MRKRTVTVNDKMQKGYRYVLSAAAGRGFDPEFKPQLTPAQMLRLGMFAGKYMTDCRRAQLFRCRCQPAAGGMEAQGLDPSGRSARLVSMVLPLL